MNITKTIITATVALTLVAMIAPMTVGATTTSDLQAQIAALQAQLNSLNGSTTTTTSSGSMPAACVGVTFSRNLKVGMSGQDVQCLQVILNMSASTQVSLSGAGSPGMESMYFGPRTLSAVMKWQAQQGWTPAAQIGPLSRAKLNAWLMGTTNTTTTTTTTTNNSGCTSSSGYSPVTGQPCSSTTTVSNTGPVSVMLSSDTPAAGGSIVGGQATADLAHFTFTGSGTVTSVTLQRSGISDQNTLTNVYLYDGNTRLTDGYSFNINGQIVINGLSIVVNGSHEISVKADVEASAADSASSIAVAMSGYTANGTASTVNVMGNSMYIVVGNLASATLSANTAAGGSGSTSTTVNAGTTGYTFWSAPLQINTRAVWLKVANFKMIGSAPSDALSNMRMFIDGVDTGKVGTVVATNGSNYAMFDFTAAPISLMTGSHTIDFRADVQKGSDRNLTVSIQQASDLVLYDSQVGVNIAVGGTVPNNAGQVTINTGSATVVVDPTFSAMTNISGGATNVVIGRFIVHAYGEDVKISSLNVIPAILNAAATGCTTNGSGVASGTCGINNVTLYFNGSQVGSQVNYSATNSYTMGTVTGGTAIPFSLGSQMIAPAGQDSVLEVRADLQTSTDYAYTSGTVQVGLPAETVNAQGQSSQNTTGVPSGAVATNGLSIQTGLLAVSKNSSYLNQSISPNTAGVRIGSYIIQNQSTSESERITSYSIATTTVTATINNFSALRTSDTTGSGSTPIQFSGTGTGTTSTDVFSVNDTLAPGASMVLDVFANTSTATSGSIATTLNVSSIGVVDNLPTTSGAKSGQTLSLGTGTIANPPTIVVSSTTPSQYISTAGGATNASQATFNFVTNSQGAATITELKFTVSGSDASASNTVTNVCVTPTSGAAVCASPVTLGGLSTADLTGLSLVVPNGGGGLTQNVQVSYSSVGTTGLTQPTSSKISLAFVKYTSGGTTSTLGTSAICTASSITCTDNTLTAVGAPTLTLVGSKPTLVIATGGATGLIFNQSTKVGQVTVTADPNGAIKLRQLDFSLGYSGFTSNTGAGPSSIASAFLALGGQSTAISGITCTPVGITNVVCKTTTNTGSFTYANDFIIGAGQSQQFDLYMTTTGEANTGTNKASVSSSLVNGTDTTSTANTSSAFLWDDTSTNGGTGTTGLTGTLIYGFPTGAYSVSQ